MSANAIAPPANQCAPSQRAGVVTVDVNGASSVTINAVSTPSAIAPAPTMPSMMTDAPYMSPGSNKSVATAAIHVAAVSRLVTSRATATNSVDQTNSELTPGALMLMATARRVQMTR